MEDKKTAYDWCLGVNLRVLDLKKEDEEWYYTKLLSKDEFLPSLNDYTVKPNSTPRKTAPYLEYRMYGLVPYNISGIQAGIQYGHALQEYNNIFLDGEIDLTDLEKIAFDKWRKSDKTFIICNGGTTNEDINDKWYGIMQQQRDRLKETNILFAEFHEPDLNNALSGFVFLVDERVFNEELYPNYADMPYPWQDKGRGYRPKDEEMEKWEIENAKNREKWVEKIGGPDNDFLRQYVNKRIMRLANN